MSQGSATSNLHVQIRLYIWLAAVDLLLALFPSQSQAYVRMCLQRELLGKYTLQTPMAV